MHADKKNVSNHSHDFWDITNSKQLKSLNYQQKKNETDTNAGRNNNILFHFLTHKIIFIIINNLQWHRFQTFILVNTHMYIISVYNTYFSIFNKSNLQLKLIILSVLSC